MIVIYSLVLLDVGEKIDYEFSSKTSLALGNRFRFKFALSLQYNAKHPCFRQHPHCK